MVIEMLRPGTKLQELLKDNNMSRKELAERTGVTEKHIGSIILGNNNITLSFAKKLEYVFELKQNDWIKMQLDYDDSLKEKKKTEGITDEEEIIYKELLPLANYMEINKNENIYDNIIKMRKYLKVSSLELVDKLAYNAAYRIRTKKSLLVDRRVLFAWQMICENRCSVKKIEGAINIEKLYEVNEKLKSIMNKDLSEQELVNTINELLNNYGIVFSIVPNVKGAPVQGFIKELNDKIILCVTTRQKRKDIFWFTIFHEIAHIMNKDYKNTFVDLTSINSNAEVNADEFAANTLINSKQYKIFVLNNEITETSIRRFAKTQNVPNYIVVGRLQKDQIIDYNQFTNMLEYFK